MSTLLALCGFEWINVYHPAENLRIKAPGGGCAGLRGSDRAGKSKPLPIGVSHFAASRKANVGVFVPPRHAQRHSFIKLVEGVAFGSGKHSSNEFVSVARLLVQQGSGSRRIEGERLQV